MRFILIALILVSCSPQKRLNRKLDRAERFARKHELIIKDTVLIKDTLVIESHTSDTLTQIISHDTVTVIDNERVTLKYFYDTTHIWHEIECKADTLIREIPVPVDRIIKQEKTGVTWWILLIPFGLVVLLILRR